MAKKKIESIKGRVFLVVIDASQEQNQAIRYACKRAASTGGRVALFKCLSPAEFQHFAGVAEIMRTEARENAEKLLRKIGETVIEITGQMPVLYVREGDAKEELLNLKKKTKSVLRKSVVFLCGYRSDKTATKANFIEKLRKKCNVHWGK